MKHISILFAVCFIFLTACSDNSGTDSDPSTSSIPSDISAFASSLKLTPTTTMKLSQTKETEQTALVSLGNGKINGLAWSPDGSELAVASARGVWCYDAENLSASPELLDFPSVGVAYSPDGSVIAASSLNGDIVLWAVESGARLRKFDAVSSSANNINFQTRSHLIYPPTFSPDGMLLALQVGESVLLWDLDKETSTPQVFAIPDERLLGIGFSTDNSLLAAGSVNNLPKIDVFDVFVPAEEPNDFSIRLYNLISGEQIVELAGATGPAQQVVFIDQSHIAAILQRAGVVGESSTTMFWQLPGGEARALSAELGVPVPGAATLTANKTHLLTIYRTHENDQLSGFNTAKTYYYFGIWNAISGELVSIFRNEPREGYFMETAALSPIGDRLVIVDYEYALAVWSLNDEVFDFSNSEPIVLPRPIQVINDHSGSYVSLGFTMNGRHLAGRAQSGAVDLWNIANGTLIERFLPEEYDAKQLGLGVNLEVVTSGAQAICSNGELVALRDPMSQIQVRTRDTDELVSTLLPTYRVTALAFNQNCTILVSGGEDGALSLWNYESGNEQLIQNGQSGFIHQLLFDLNGNRLFSVANHREENTYSSIHIWDTTSGDLLAVITSEIGEAFDQITVHPSGKLLAIAVEGSRPRVSLLDLAKNESPNELPVYAWGVSAMTFSSDGTQIAVASDDGIVSIWGISE